VAKEYKLVNHVLETLFDNEKVRK